MDIWSGWRIQGNTKGNRSRRGRDHRNLPGKCLRTACCAVWDIPWEANYTWRCRPFSELFKGCSKISLGFRRWTLLWSVWAWTQVFEVRKVECQTDCINGTGLCRHRNKAGCFCRIRVLHRIPKCLYPKYWRALQRILFKQERWIGTDISSGYLRSDGVSAKGL